MSPRFHAAIAVVLIAAALSATAARTEQRALEPQMVEPPKTLPRPQAGDAKLNLDRLFEALKVAPDAESAKYVEGRIWALWLASGSDTANLLMGRVKTAMEGKDARLAIELLTAVIGLRPEYVEAWNRRASLYFAGKDFTAS